MKSKSKKTEKPVRGPIDYPFLIIVILILSIGLVMVFSASYPTAVAEGYKPTKYFFSQVRFAILGLGLMAFFASIDYRYLRGRLSLILLVGSALLLVAVLAMGYGDNIERRWIRFGGFSFQPSEVAKIGIIFFFASYISLNSDKMHSLRKGLWPLLLALAVIGGLVVAEPHLSGTVLILGVGAVLMFVGGMHWAWFASAFAIGAGGIWAMIKYFGYASNRILAWKNPFDYARTLGYQSVQGLYAMGAGGLFGLGFGNSRQKHLYLPEAHNDFIFAIVCEELGFIGAMIVILLFVMLILRGYWIAIRARDKFGALVVTGIISLIALQTIFNIAVVTGVFPVTGISLPFFSYGGTSLVILLAQMGVVLSVSRYAPAPKAG